MKMKGEGDLEQHMHPVQKGREVEFGSDGDSNILRLGERQEGEDLEGSEIFVILARSL